MVPDDVEMLDDKFINRQIKIREQILSGQKTICLAMDAKTGDWIPIDQEVAKLIGNGIRIVSEEEALSICLGTGDELPPNKILAKTNFKEVCSNCGRRGFKTDSFGNVVCARCSKGQVPRLTSHLSPPRNGPCYCGSGKKFKHCCIGKKEFA